MTAAYLNQKLKTAIEKQDEGAIEQLLECGADPNAFLSGEDIAPIHLGPGMSKSITFVLLKYGGDPNLRTSDGITPLHIAATWGYKSIVKLLLRNGANVYIRDDEGFTPLDMAKKYEHEKCEIILKQHLQLLEFERNSQKRKVRQKPPLNTKTETYSIRLYDNRNVDPNQNLPVDPEYQSSPVKREKPRRSMLYRKEIQNQIDHLCENEEDFHLDVTSPNHPCVNVTPKMQFHLSSPKHIRAYSEPMTENTSTPIRPRRSLYTTSVQHKIDRFTGGGKNVSIDVTSPDHPELFLTPTANSPSNYHQKVHGEAPINSHKQNVMRLKSSDSSDICSSSSLSDLYVTVNEPSDEAKHSMTHKLEQLRNCFNKLETQKPFVTNLFPVSKPSTQVQDKLYSRSKEPYYSKALPPEKELYSKQMHQKVLGPNHDVDVKFTMELPPKMVLDDRKIRRKFEHSQPQTIELNVGQRYKKNEYKNSKKEPIIDIQIQPKSESHNIKYKVRNKKEADQQINQKSKCQDRNKASSKRKVELKSPEIQQKHNSRVRSKSAHENTCSYAEQDRKDYYKSPEKNINGRYRQETYPGERISTVHLTHENQRGSKRYDHNDAIDPSVLVTHDSRSRNEKSNEHSKNAYVTKSTENVPPSSHRHVTSRNYKSKLSSQNRELPHHSNMTNEKMTPQTHVQHNERASHFSREQEIIPEKSSYSISRKDLIFPTRFRNDDEKNARLMKLKDLSNSQQKTVFIKERSESKYLNCNPIHENQIFRQRGCMVINQEPKIDAVQKIVSRKVAHTSHEKKATKLPESVNTDRVVYSRSAPSNTDFYNTQFSNRSRQSMSSVTSTDTYYTCSSELDTEDFFSCENGLESCSEAYLTFLTDAGRRPFPSSFEELTEMLSSKDSSYLREFEFNQDELIRALSEFNLREPNTSTLTETFFNALSSIGKHNDKEVEKSTDRSINQSGNTQVGKHKQGDGTLCRTGSPLQHVSPIDMVNSHHIRRRTRITASSPPHETLDATDGQYEEFETAIEEVLLSRSPSKYKSKVSNQILSEGNSFLQESSGQYHSGAVSSTGSKSESNTSDTFFLVCVPPADNQFLCTASQDSANISNSVTFDEVNHQYGGILRPQRDETSSLNPVEPDLFQSCIENENMPGKIKDTKNPYTIDFSKVLSELKQKTDLKALQSQKKTCYRWQPPENVMNSSHTTDESFLNGKERDQKLKVLKKKVGLELKNHPLVKSQKFAIDKSSDSHYISAQEKDLHTSQVLHDKNEQKHTKLYYNPEEDKFNETQLKSISTRKYLDGTRQPQLRKPNILRQNVSNQKSFSKSDTDQTPYKCMQIERKTCKELSTRKIAEKNQSLFPSFDASYNPSSGKDDSVHHSCYLSFEKEPGNSKERVSNDDSVELEQSCYASVHRECSLNAEHSCYTSVRSEGSLDTKQSRYISVHGEDSLDMEHSCNTSAYGKNSPNVEQSCYVSTCRDESKDTDYLCCASVHKEELPETEQSCYVSVHGEESTDVEKSGYNSAYRKVHRDMDKSCYVPVCREGSSDADKSCYASIQKEGSTDMDQSCYVSYCRDGSLDTDRSCYIHRKGSPDMDQSCYVSVCKNGSMDTDRSCYTSVRREGSSEEDRSLYTSARRERSPEVDRSLYTSARRERSPEVDRSCYTSVRRERSPEEDRSYYTSVRREGSSEEDQSCYTSVRRERSPEVDRSLYTSARRERSLEVDRSCYTSVRRERSPEEDQSYYTSVRREGSSEEDQSCYTSVRREQSPEEDQSYYTSVRREGSSEEDQSRYTSVRRERSPEVGRSCYTSVRREGSPEVDRSCYTSVRREGSSEEDQSCYTSVRRDRSPDMDQSRYVSIRQGNYPDADRSCPASVGRENFQDTDKSCYISVRREDSPETNRSCYTSIHREGPPVTFKRLSTKSSRNPTLIDGKLQRQQKVIDSPSNNEPVTLQKRYISSPPPPPKNESLYVSAENMTSGKSFNKDSFFTEDEQSKSNFESVADNVTCSSHWQYLSTKSSVHNRSVTWQNPISTFDKVDAALVDSTDESISWSPKEKGHSPQAIPLTSTSASEEITSESVSSDEFKRCLERKKLISAEERTTMWVNGIHKSNMQAYFDADMSSILPVLNSNTSSSDTGKDIKCGTTAANMRNHHYIEPSAPPQSEIIQDRGYPDSFRCIPTAPPDISNIAVAGNSGDKVNELSSNDYISLHPSLYPSLVEPCQNSVLKKYSGPQLNGNNNNDGDNSESRALNASAAAYVSFDSEPEPPPANVHSSPQSKHKFIQNTPSSTETASKMCSVNFIPPAHSQEVNNKPFPMRSNTVNQLHQITKSISTQTPVLRIPPDPPNKSESLPAAFTMSTQIKEHGKEKLTQKGWAKLKKIFTGKKIHGKIGNKAFISVDSNQSFLPRLDEISPPLTDTSGTQTDPDIFYEPTLKHLEIVKSDEVSLSVNFSEQLSDYSEKYPSSILPAMAEYLEQAIKNDFLETCSSSGATSGSMERLLSPFREDSNEDDDLDEVDHVQSNTYPINYRRNEDFGKDKYQPISTETKIYGETYKTQLSKADKRRKSNNVEFLHTDPEMKVQFIERRISTESQNGDQLDDSESTDIYDWKSFSKSTDDDLDSVPQTENKSLYWRTCRETPDDVKTNVKKPLADLGCLSNAQFRQTLIDHGLSHPGPITKDTRQMYLKRLKNKSGHQTLACTLSAPDYNAELCRALNEKIDWTEMVELEEKMIKRFDNSKNTRKWREGNEKSSFNYLLLDPRVTRNLPCRAAKMDDTLETFHTFVKAIFYIGKGKRSRPYAHLYEAIKYSQGNTTKINEKTTHINDIWESGYGVVSLHCFQNVIPVEAYSREACMVDAIGCCNLTNKKRGDFYGLTSTWCLKLKRRMGVYLLNKALKIFMAEGERQIYPTDLH